MICERLPQILNIDVYNAIERLSVVVINGWEHLKEWNDFLIYILFYNGMNLFCSKPLVNSTYSETLTYFIGAMG